MEFRLAPANVERVTLNQFLIESQRGESAVESQRGESAVESQRGEKEVVRMIGETGKEINKEK